MKIFEDQDTIVKLPSDPKKLEAYFKRLPADVIEEFAKNALKEGERRGSDETPNLIREIIFRLARANKYGPIAGHLSNEQRQLLKNKLLAGESADPTR